MLRSMFKKKTEFGFIFQSLNVHFLLFFFFYVCVVKSNSILLPAVGILTVGMPDLQRVDGEDGDARRLHIQPFTN